MDEQNHRSMDRRSLLARGGAVAVGAVGVTVAGVATAAPALAAGLGYTPITPYRSVDSRSEGKIASNQATNLQLITDVEGKPTVVPATAQAVTFNLTITRTEGQGFLGVVPPGTSLNPLPVSNINWVVAGLDLANSGTTKVATADNKPGSVLLFCGGSGRTDFIIDVTGYFAP